jgi:signal transduction histidine kinase
MHDIIGKKKISLTYTPPSVALPYVWADKTQTEQVFINLISNAIKYTEEGSIIVTIETAGNFSTIKVIDTGKGIDEKNKLLLFKKFQQAGGDVFVGDYATSSGLGLYISKLLVKNMGGDIGLEQSTSGSGSTFFFTLPVAI